MKNKTAAEVAIEHGLCTCDEAYTSRGLTAPDCPYHAFALPEAMQAYTDQEKAGLYTEDEVLQALQSIKIDIMDAYNKPCNDFDALEIDTNHYLKPKQQ